MNNNLLIPKDKVADFCSSHHIRRLSIFGSALRDDSVPDSDVDVLVEFDPGHTPGFLSRYFRSKVLKEAEVQYAGN